jgi:hypothetical protein
MILGTAEAVACEFARLESFVKGSVDSCARSNIASKVEKINATASCLLLCEINEREAKGHIQP